MSILTDNYQKVSAEIPPQVTLVAVSKTKPASLVAELYASGHRDFGENYVQELVEKQAALPGDIRWHFIGHLQSNKVKMIAPFVHLVHGVDSLRLLKEINKEALKNNRIIDVLLQVHIATEETKFGLSPTELAELMRDPEIETLLNVRICGLMGMASFTQEEAVIRKEFETLYRLFKSQDNGGFSILSMGMSADFRLAIETGSTMVRIGSTIFGNR